MRIDSSTICGTDLHILKGDVPETTPGTVLGHEAIGTVAGGRRRVTHRRPRRPRAGLVHQRLRPLPLLQEGHYGQCLGGGGWILGHTIDGLQAEYARIPFADNSSTSCPTT